MFGRPERSGSDIERWLGIGAVLAAVAIAVIVIATRNGSQAPPVILVLTHATIHADWQDATVAVNKSGYPVGYACGVDVMPRTTATFRVPLGASVCSGRNIPIAAHSRHRVQPSIQPEPPGKYWVWFQYWRGGVGHGLVHTAYTQLTVVGRSPDVLLVLAHATVRVGSADAVDLVNKGSYLAANTGCSGPVVSPRTSAKFHRPNDLFCTGGAGPSASPHSRVRVATSITPGAPGKYWVWFDYYYGPVGGATIETTAYTTLTVLAP